MKVGFAKVDITPRLGVEMAGFGPFVHRIARDLRDRLWARAMAASDGDRRWVLISAELVGVDAPIVRKVRELLAEWTSLAPAEVMCHATHTHSGPAVLSETIGWGEPDLPYLLRLPSLLAAAGREALGNLQDVPLSTATFPVNGVAYNREQDERPAYDDAMRDNWRPALPEHTDTAGRVICAAAAGRLTGFLAHYSCHPVVCCEQTHSLHGDYCGVAMHALEDEHPGAVGMFLQGAHADINTCVCHMPQAESMRALDVIAERFARGVRTGIGQAQPLAGDSVAAVSEELTIRRAGVSADDLRQRVRDNVQALLSDAAGDAGRDARMAAIGLTAARRSLARLEANGSLDEVSEAQALRLGEVLIFGLPLELFRGVGRHVQRAVGREPMLVLSNANGALGYAVTRRCYQEKGPRHYARDIVPRIHGSAAFREDLEDDLVDACVKLAGQIA